MTRFFFIIICLFCLKSYGVESISLKKKAEDILIVANGPFEEDVVRFYKEKEMLIIALDGAADILRDHDIKPDIILGDMDSIDDDVSFEKSIQVVKTPDQNETDLSKGIIYGRDTLKAKNIYVACALGGARTDHTFENLSLLKKHHRLFFNIYVVTPTEIIQFLRDETLTFQARVGEKLGLFGFPKARATSSQGSLKWPLNESYPLELGQSSSACNIVTSPQVTLTIKGEALLIRPRL